MGQSPKLRSITLGAMGMRVKHYCGSGQQARSKAGLTVRQSALIAHREIEMDWFKARDPPQWLNSFYRTCATPESTFSHRKATISREITNQKLLRAMQHVGYGAEDHPMQPYVLLSLFAPAGVDRVVVLDAAGSGHAQVEIIGGLRGGPLETIPQLVRAMTYACDQALFSRN